MNKPVRESLNGHEKGSASKSEPGIVTPGIKANGSASHCEGIMNATLLLRSPVVSMRHQQMREGPERRITSIKIGSLVQWMLQS